jgi:hypothetical protein
MALAIVMPNPTSGRAASRKGWTVRGRLADQPSHSTTMSSGHTQSGVWTTMSKTDGMMSSHVKDAAKIVATRQNLHANCVE